MIEKSFYLSICPLAIIIEVSAPLLNWYCSCLNSGFLEILHEAATPTTIGVGRKEQAWAGAPGGVWGQQCPRAELPEQEGELLLEHVCTAIPPAWPEGLLIATSVQQLSDVCHMLPSILQQSALQGVLLCSTVIYLPQTLPQPVTSVDVRSLIRFEKLHAKSRGFSLLSPHFWWCQWECFPYRSLSWFINFYLFSW